jgi:hypothetical protein
MIALRLTRELMIPACSSGVLEVLTPDGETSLRLFTIEKPFIPSAHGGRAGEPFRSCIGPGVYALENFVRPNGDKVWRLSNPDLDVFKLDTDIPAARQAQGRFLILIHAGNRARDVVGCIAPGRQRRTDGDGTHMVTSSREAMKDLHKALDGRRNLQIEIVNAAGALSEAMTARAIPAATAPATVRAPAMAAASATAAAPVLVSDQTPNLHNWLRVPQGSKLVIGLSGTTANALVTGSGNIRSDNAPPRTFRDSEVQPGPLEVHLSGQDSCTVVLNLQFGKKATADVKAFVEAPGGAHVPVDYHQQFPRAQGSSESIVFNVVTV